MTYFWAVHIDRPYGALKIFHTGGSVVGVGVAIWVLTIGLCTGRRTLPKPLSSPRPWPNQLPLPVLPGHVKTWLWFSPFVPFRGPGG